MFNNEQNDALKRAQLILQEAGLQLSELLPDPKLSVSNLEVSSSSTNFDLGYTSPEPTTFTAEDILLNKNSITKKARAAAVVHHPFGAIVEFPETGTETKMGIAHLFPIDPSTRNFLNPKDNIQYSLGGRHSMHSNVLCYLLRDKDTGKPVYCKQTKTTCRSIKRCSFNVGTNEILEPILDAHGELFMKTLGFFCALKEHGCSFSIAAATGETSDDSEAFSEDDQQRSNGDLTFLLQSSHSPRKQKSRICQGKLLLEKDRFGHFFIRCEYFAKGKRNHLQLRNLNEYDTGYLSALFYSELKKISRYELAAAQQGYGPLVACSVMAVARGQKELCPMWHRDINGILQRGKMVTADECKCSFEIYQPNDLVQCPNVLIVSRNPHSHRNPMRTKTPAAIHQKFMALLEPLNWKLADATPRRILLDNSFMHDLRRLLKWTDIRDPSLGNLHPSLANYDHTARLIDELRQQLFPEGTGLEGAKYLRDKHSKLPPEEQYIRRIETFHPSAADAMWNRL